MVRNVLDDVLLLSKIEEGKIKFSKIAFSLVPWLEELELMFSEQAQMKGLTLDSRTRGLDPQIHVVGDRNRLAEVVANLLGNAVKFTAEGGIELKIEQQAVTSTSVTIEVAVTDTGPGLSEEQINSLFEPYKSLSESSAERWCKRHRTRVGDLKAADQSPWRRGVRAIRRYWLWKHVWFQNNTSYSACLTRSL